GVAEFGVVDHRHFTAPSPPPPRRRRPLPEGRLRFFLRRASCAGRYESKSDRVTFCELLRKRSRQQPACPRQRYRPSYTFAVDPWLEPVDPVAGGILQVRTRAGGPSRYRRRRR